LILKKTYFSDFVSDKLKSFHNLFFICLWSSTSVCHLFFCFFVIIDSFFDWSKIFHINLFDKKSSKCSPEDGEDSSAENAEWSNSELEVKFSFTMHNCIVILLFEWL